VNGSNRIPTELVKTKDHLRPDIGHFCDVDVASRRCQIAGVKSSKAGTLLTGVTEAKTTGTKMVEKYRPRMSRLTDAERQRLMERGMQIIYGESAEAKPAHRR
jgi:hypothetical protein